MYRYLRFAAQSLVAFCFLFVFNSTLLSQEIALKPKYSYTTPALKSAQELYSKKKYSEALSAFEKIISEAEKQQNYEEVVYAMEKKALTLRRLGTYDKVISTMDEAISLATEHLPKDHFLISKMYYTRGSTDHILRKYYDARAFMDTALIFYDKANTYDSMAKYRIMEYKYYAYQYSEGSSDTLLKYLNELVEYELAETTNIKHDRVLNLLQGYPEIYMQKGDFEQALAFAIRGYKYAKEKRPLVSDRYYAEAQYELVQTLYLKKDFSRALDIGLKAMPLVESIPRSNMPEYYAFNNLLGLANMRLGKFDVALTYLDKAVDLPMDVGDRFQQEDRYEFRAKVLINLGLCYINLGDLERGKLLLDQSLNKMKDLVDTPSPSFHENYENLGDYYSNSQNWSAALISYDSALRNGLAAYNGSLTSFPKSDDSDADVINSFSYSDLRTLSKKALTMRKLAIDSKEALNLLKAALDYVRKTHLLLMKNREGFIVSEGKLFLSENFKGLYETGLETCFALYELKGGQEYFDLALDFARQSKAILFLEQSQEFELVNNNLLAQEDKDSFFEAKKRIDKLQASFYDLIDNSITSDSVIKLNEELLIAREENLFLKKKITTILDGFNQGQSRLIEATNSSNKLVIEEGNALIEFFYGEDNIYVLGKSSTKTSFHKVELNQDFRNSLRQLVGLLIQAPNLNSIEEDFRSFAQNSHNVYQQLLEPTLRDLGNQLEQLTIVPDEFLARLPFEALVQDSSEDAKGFDQLKYLVRNFGIQYQLSSQRLGQNSREASVANGLLGIGYKEDHVSQNRSGYGSLPGTEQEIRFLKANIDGEYLIGESGTKVDFLNKARGYDILHLAVHGRADSTSRYESSLIFNGSEDNVLNTNDLYLAGLKARLAVLSACESGSGLVNNGEGTFSIARGFALVGTPSVVMSLWKVNDRVTSGLMVNMYRGFIEEGRPINQALRSAKLDYLEDSDAYLAHPYYWAAFLHLGENTVLNPDLALNKVNMTLVFVLIGIILIIVLLFLKKRRRAN